jgi:hypothetical protein
MIAIIAISSFRRKPAAATSFVFPVSLWVISEKTSSIRLQKYFFQYLGPGVPLKDVLFARCLEPYPPQLQRQFLDLLMKARVGKQVQRRFLGQ